MCRKTVVRKMSFWVESVLKFENQLVVFMLCFIEVPDAFSVFLLVSFKSFYLPIPLPK
jgi:hypothetical protein